MFKPCIIGGAAFVLLLLGIDTVATADYFPSCVRQRYNSNPCSGTTGSYCQCICGFELSCIRLVCYEKGKPDWQCGNEASAGHGFCLTSCRAVGHY